jgi:cytochrome c peroxidase
MRGTWMIAVLTFTSACILEPPEVGRDGATYPEPHPGRDAGPDAAPPPGPDAGLPPGPDTGYSGLCPPRDDLRQLPVTPDNLPDVPLTTKELLGKVLFFDTNLSTPLGQSCAVCHLGETGWTGPDERINATGAVYEGAVEGRFGNRKVPPSAYATPAPLFALYAIDGEELFAGGNFWDGRATGEKLGNPAADQAQGPPLNPVEQNNPDIRTVCVRIRDSDYAYRITGRTYEQLFEAVYGPGALDCDVNVQRTYDFFAIAIATWEDSCQVNEYSSKYDAYLHGEAMLTDEEIFGLELFQGKAMCSNCHTIEPGPRGEPPLFTDFTYDNLGVPRNPCNPWYLMPEWLNPLGLDWIDPGLGGAPQIQQLFPGYAPGQLGKMKVPTLRNVDKRPDETFIKAYMHNGFFKSLESVVHFYNTRDTLPACEDIPGIPGLITDEVARQYDCWPAPEMPVNVNTAEVGDLGLTEAEEAAVVAFMKTLSDGYTAPRNCQRAQPRDGDPAPRVPGR